jgi:hypothetical protein
MRLSSWLRYARPAKRTPSTPLGVERLDDRIVPSTFTVRTLADSGPDSLRAAISAANANPGADVVTFARGLRGTVTLTGGELGITDDLRIDGPGANKITVSGSDVSRVFNIGSGAAVSIDDLTVAHGHGLLRGGGILNNGALTLTHSVVSENEVVGVPGAVMADDAFGGGILNTGTLTVRDSTFVHNRSAGGDGNPGGPGSGGLGGAIMSVGLNGAPATTTIIDSTFLDNEAVGGAAGAHFPFTRSGLGGALMNDAGTMTISGSLFRDNRAVGGTGGGFPGGVAAGGAIANIALIGDAKLFVNDSVLANNEAMGGAAPAGTAPMAGKGGAIANFIAGIASLPVSVAASATVTDSILFGNRAVGGDGPTGGIGQGGAITNENGGILTVTRSLLLMNEASGGAGASGDGGSARGGGIFNGPPNPFGVPNLTLDDTLVALNRADGGTSSGGSSGLGVGGGLYLSPGGAASAAQTLVFANDASINDDVFGILV